LPLSEAPLAERKSRFRLPRHVHASNRSVNTRESQIDFHGFISFPHFWQKAFLKAVRCPQDSQTKTIRAVVGRFRLGGIHIDGFGARRINPAAMHRSTSARVSCWPSNMGGRLRIGRFMSNRL
jgi:hypothetical protein